MNRTPSHTAPSASRVNSSRFSLCVALRFLTCLLLLCGEIAIGTPALLGSDAPEFRVSDGNDRTVNLESLKGKTVVLLYETRDEAVIERNRTLKTTLKEYLYENPSISAMVAVIAVIDCSSAISLFKGIWKSKILEHSEKENLPIYCDWSGDIGKAYDLDATQSNIVLIDQSGKIVFIQTGRVSVKAFPFDLLGK